MKISIEDDPFTTIDWNGSSVYNHWQVVFDEGITQAGSSGAPILDQNHRVVGNLHGGLMSGNACNDTLAAFGKFSLSWTGGGTNDTRLSNWLDPNNTGITIQPSSFDINILGQDTIYDSNVYVTSSIPSFYTVTWYLSGANASSFIVQNDTPSTNQCTITMRDSVDFVAGGNLVLNAQVMYNNVIINTISKSLTPVYISGSTIPSSSEMYQIGNLPDNTVVSWNWTGKGLTIGSTPIMVEPYYSTNNYFNLLRSNMTYAKGIITANIMQGGNTIFVLTKTVDTGVNYSGGTWYQGNSSSNTLACGNAYDIVSNSQVVLQSNSFIGKTVSYSTDGFVLFGGLSHSGSNIVFTPISSIPHSLGDEPQAFGVKSVTINVTDPATYETFEFTFHEQLPFDDPLMMNVNSSGNEYTFTMEDIQKDRSQTWTLDVVNSETGRIAYHKKSNTTTQTINTTGWKKGVYIVKVTIGSQIISRKLTIP